MLPLSVCTGPKAVLVAGTHEHCSTASASGSGRPAVHPPAAEAAPARPARALAKQLLAKPADSPGLRYCTCHSPPLLLGQLQLTHIWPCAEHAWTEAAATAGLQDPPALYSQRSLAAVSGCTATLQQHARTCAIALAQRLTRHHDFETENSPALSCLNTQLTLSAAANPGRSDTPQVVLAEAAHAGTRVLPVSLPDVAIRTLSFSPDGAHLALVCTEEGERLDGSEHIDLHLLDVQTGGLTSVWDLCPHCTRGVRWAPNSRLLAVHGPELALVAVDGSVVTQKPTIGWTTQPSWQPDSGAFCAAEKSANMPSHQQVTWVTCAGRIVHGLPVHGLTVMTVLPFQQQGQFWLATIVQVAGACDASLYLVAVSAAAEHAPTCSCSLQPGAHTISAAAQSIAVCSAAQQASSVIHIFAVQTHGALSLHPSHCLTVDGPSPECALSSCGIFLAFFQKSQGAAQKELCLAVHMIVSPVPGQAWPLPAGLHHHQTIHWAPDTSSLAAAGSEQRNLRSLAPPPGTRIALRRTRVFKVA